MNYMPFHRIHFEKKNVEETAKMMDYVGTKPWDHGQKPHRQGLEQLMRKADKM